MMEPKILPNTSLTKRFRSPEIARITKGNLEPKVVRGVGKHNEPHSVLCVTLDRRLIALRAFRRFFLL